MYFYLQLKFIQFTLKNIFPFDEKIIEAKEQYFKTQPYKKWTYWEYITLQNLLSAQHRLPLWNTENKTVVDVAKN